MNFRTVAARVAVAVFLGSSVSAGPATAAPDPDDARLYGPGSTSPAGASLQTWATRMFTWFQETPAHQRLGVDPGSPANCVPRHGAVVFGPVGTDDTCLVPAGRPIVVVYLGWSCSTAEGNGRTFLELRRCAERNWRTELGDIRIRQVVDGNLVGEPRRWTVSTGDMWVDLPRHNVWGVRPGWTRSVGRAIVHVLKPPPVGSHLVRVRLLEDGKKTVLRYPFTVQ